MSHRGPCGRGNPRWSVPSHADPPVPAWAGFPVSSAGEMCFSAWVGVGPPLIVLEPAVPPTAEIPPPLPVPSVSSSAVLFTIVRLLSVAVPPVTAIPPPFPSARLPLMVTFASVAVPDSTWMAPPFSSDSFDISVTPRNVRPAWLSIPPPSPVSLPFRMVRSEAVREFPAPVRTSKTLWRSPPSMTTAPVGSRLTGLLMSRSPSSVSSGVPSSGMASWYVPAGMAIVSGPAVAPVHPPKAASVFAATMASRSEQPAPLPLSSACVVTLIVPASAIGAGPATVTAAANVAAGLAELHGPALGPTARGPGHVQGGRDGVGAWDDELVRQGRLVAVDQLLELFHHFGSDQRDPGTKLGPPLRIRGQVGPHHEEGPLDLEEDVGHGLVDAAVRLCRRIGLRDPAAVEEPGGPIVPGPRVDLAHPDRIAPAARAQPWPEGAPPWAGVPHVAIEPQAPRDPPVERVEHVGIVEPVAVC